MKKFSLCILSNILFFIGAEENKNPFKIGSQCAWVAHIPQDTYLSSELPEFQRNQQEICIEVQKKMEELAKKYAHLLSLKHGKTVVIMNVDVIAEKVIEQEIHTIEIEEKQNS